MKKKKQGSYIILQPENLHLWHFQFLFEAVLEQSYSKIDKIWQWPPFLLSLAHFLVNYVKNCSAVAKNSERFCNYINIVGKVSLIHFV